MDGDNSHMTNIFENLSKAYPSIFPESYFLHSKFVDLDRSMQRACKDLEFKSECQGEFCDICNHSLTSKGGDVFEVTVSPKLQYLTELQSSKLEGIELLCKMCSSLRDAHYLMGLFCSGSNEKILLAASHFCEVNGLKEGDEVMNLRRALALSHCIGLQTRNHNSFAVLDSNGDTVTQFNVQRLLFSLAEKRQRATSDATPSASKVVPDSNSDLQCQTSKSNSQRRKKRHSKTKDALNGSMSETPKKRKKGKSSQK